MKQNNKIKTAASPTAANAKPAKAAVKAKPDSPADNMPKLMSRKEFDKLPEHSRYNPINDGSDKIGYTCPHPAGGYVGIVWQDPDDKNTKMAMSATFHDRYNAENAAIKLAGSFYGKAAPPSAIDESTPAEVKPAAAEPPKPGDEVRIISSIEDMGYIRVKDKVGFTAGMLSKCKQYGYFVYAFCQKDHGGAPDDIAQYIGQTQDRREAKKMAVAVYQEHANVRRAEKDEEHEKSRQGEQQIRPRDIDKMGLSAVHDAGRIAGFYREIHNAENAMANSFYAYAYTDEKQPSVAFFVAKEYTKGIAITKIIAAYRAAAAKFAQQELSSQKPKTRAAAITIKVSGGTNGDFSVEMNGKPIGKISQHVSGGCLVKVDGFAIMRSADNLEKAALYAANAKINGLPLSITKSQLKAKRIYTKAKRLRKAA
ncbi:MAG: hypothetical protein ACR2PR_11215 [Pseudohongiellaceae bacterium]